MRFRYTVQQLTNLRHFNGHAVAVVYGHEQQQAEGKVAAATVATGAPHGAPAAHPAFDKHFDSAVVDYGGIVAFNLRRSDGSWVGFRSAPFAYFVTHSSHASQE